MNIEELNGQCWYLAQYITGGKNRERLFNWLSDQQVTPWTPLAINTLRRTDKINCTRKRVYPLFPGYFFLKANLSTQSVDQIRLHSAFCGFVMNGSQIAPLRPSVVEGLMKLHPDPTLNPDVRDELEAASHTWLTTAQYQYLLRMEQHSRPVSRIELLMQLVFQPTLLGF
ncbi:transcription termination factor NusG [Yersinia kristensenii]|nr:transcription termination factor NusG [Yersinia kristensenii]